MKQLTVIKLSGPGKVCRLLQQFAVINIFIPLHEPNVLLSDMIRIVIKYNKD